MRMLLLSLFFITPAFAGEKVTVVGVPGNEPTLGSSPCVVPFVCKRDGAYNYQSGVWGRPEFLSGSVTLLDGTKIKGKIALFQRQQDWDFVKHVALLIPEGEQSAIYVGSGAASVLTQTDDDETKIYDLYGSLYLERLVSGKRRLSYNPAAGTSAAITNFIYTPVLGDIQRELAAKEVLAALKDGKSLDEVSKSGTASQTVTEIISAVEITEKEYLYYNEVDQTTTLIKEDNYQDAMAKLFAGCGSADPDQVKKLSRKFKEIEKAFKYANKTCPL